MQRSPCLLRHAAGHGHGIPKTRRQPNTSESRKKSRYARTNEDGENLQFLFCAARLGATASAEQHEATGSVRMRNSNICCSCANTESSEAMRKRPLMRLSCAERRTARHARSVAVDLGDHVAQAASSNTVLRVAGRHRRRVDIRQAAQRMRVIPLLTGLQHARPRRMVHPDGACDAGHADLAAEVAHLEVPCIGTAASGAGVTAKKAPPARRRWRPRP